MKEKPEDATVNFDTTALLQTRGDSEVGAQLVVIEGDCTGQRLVLNSPLSHIGRRNTNDFVLDSHTVSRDHAVVVREEEGYYVIDTHSSNGVFVNAKKIPPVQKHRLSHGDSLRLGEVVLLFQQPEQFINAQGLSTIHIDRAKVKQEVDEFFKQFQGLIQTTDSDSGEV